MTIRKAARVLREGGVIAYPTEGVFGLGCLPGDGDAVARLLALKRRDPSQGLILIAQHSDQLGSWACLPAGADLHSSAERPITWLVPAQPAVPGTIRGAHDRIAVRIAAHPVASALCEAAGSALVSTSANLSGRPPARTRFVLRRQFGRLVDYVVPGACGPAAGPSEIRDLETGETVRAASA
ncbi:MAG TPA: L-threonylcarbamoyladenylate synthase [Woeseiaceae bacterium]|jgi:L-threonylcarbamoyladenylate synthase|nr:L-threonylcarbamoyladenylate synthase [Woeseiaceae bacterium]